MTGTGTVAKPPLGVKPAYLAHNDRIMDLAQAIVRSMSGLNYAPDYRHISIWAKEISDLSDMVCRIKKEDT